jgi:hypothetical protein
VPLIINFVSDMTAEVMHGQCVPSELQGRISKLSQAYSDELAAFICSWLISLVFASAYAQPDRVSADALDAFKVRLGDLYAFDPDKLCRHVSDFELLANDPVGTIRLMSLPADAAEDEVRQTSIALVAASILGIVTENSISAIAHSYISKVASYMIDATLSFEQQMSARMEGWRLLSTAETFLASHHPLLNIPLIKNLSEGLAATVPPTTSVIACLSKFPRQVTRSIIGDEKIINDLASFISWRLCTFACGWIPVNDEVNARIRELNYVLYGPSERAGDFINKWLELYHNPGVLRGKGLGIHGDRSDEDIANRFVDIAVILVMLRLFSFDDLFEGNGLISWWLRSPGNKGQIDPAHLLAFSHTVWEYFYTISLPTLKKFVTETP